MQSMPPQESIPHPVIKLHPFKFGIYHYIKVTGYPATVEQIFYYVIEAGLGGVT